MVRSQRRAAHGVKQASASGCRGGAGTAGLPVGLPSGDVQEHPYVACSAAPTPPPHPTPPTHLHTCLIASVQGVSTTAAARFWKACTVGTRRRWGVDSIAPAALCLASNAGYLCSAPHMRTRTAWPRSLPARPWWADTLGTFRRAAARLPPAAATRSSSTSFNASDCSTSVVMPWPAGGGQQRRHRCDAQEEGVQHSPQCVSMRQTEGGRAAVHGWQRRRCTRRPPGCPSATCFRLRAALLHGTLWPGQARSARAIDGVEGGVRVAHHHQPLRHIHLLRTGGEGQGEEKGPGGSGSRSGRVGGVLAPCAQHRV